MKKLLIYSPDPHDGVSRYRQWGPMSLLHDQIFCASFPNEDAAISHWSWYYNYDVCLMSRPHRLQHQAFAENCKKTGLKLWIDIDDALFHIPPFNDAYPLLGTDFAQKILKNCLEMADLITVSSLSYGDWLKENLNLKCQVVQIPNALDDRLLKFKRSFQKNDRIAWRGSRSHEDDLLRQSKEIQKSMDLFPHYRFNFFGYYPYFLGGKNMEVTAQMNFLEFYQKLADYHPWLIFVPLTYSKFNQTKSNLAWLDATLVGAVTLAPANWAEWSQPGIFNYFKLSYEIERLINTDEEKLKKHYESSWNDIQENLMLSKINEIRLKIMKGDYF